MGCFIKRIIQLTNAINYIPIKLLNANKQDITNDCLYSWSTDGVCWTSWNNYQNYQSITGYLDTDFYLRILLNETLGQLLIDGSISNCFTISIYDENIFLTDFCDSQTLFQPYNNLDCALQLQTQLSDSIVCMFGIPIYYIRVTPDEETADYTFKEYVLHNVIDIKQMKLMIPDGEMPSSNPKLTEFDFDWETDWETELSKGQFAKAFGDNVFPKQRDLIYVPMMKRMWEVNSAYDEKNEGLLWRPTTWKLALVKYNEKTNVDTSKFEDIIDNWVGQTYEEVFGRLEKNEQERQTASGQVDSPSYAATNLYNIFMEDAIRFQYTKQGVTVLDKFYNHKSNVVARNIYKFNHWTDRTGTHEGEIIYQKSICGEEGTISFILETPGKFDNDILEKNIITFGEINIKMKYDKVSDKFHIIFNDMDCELEPFNSYNIILRWNRRNFITDIMIFNYIHEQNIPVYLLKPSMYWFDIQNPITKSNIYNNDYVMKDPMDCKIHAWPVSITNLKYYDRYLNNDDAIKESLKYTTNHNSCIINDLARPIDSGHGYAVK